MPGWGLKSKEKTVWDRPEEHLQLVSNHLYPVLPLTRQPPPECYMRFPNNCCNSTTDNEFDLTLVALVMVTCFCCEEHSLVCKQWREGAQHRVPAGSPLPLGQTPIPKQAGRIHSKPAWNASAVWLMHKIMLLHFGGLWIMIFNTMFHIYSYWMAPIKTRFIPSRLGSETPRCRIVDFQTCPPLLNTDNHSQLKTGCTEMGWVGAGLCRSRMRSVWGEVFCIPSHMTASLISSLCSLSWWGMYCKKLDVRLGALPHYWSS